VDAKLPTQRIARLGAPFEREVVMSIKTLKAQRNFEKALEIAEKTDNSLMEFMLAGLIDLTKVLKDLEYEVNRIKK
jgi:hypothetical protein